MNMQPVGSSNVIAVGWADGTLAIEFKGGTYRYSDVPETVFDELLASESKGSFVHQNIKDKFTVAKVG